jgi:hypothetical protein
LNKPALSDVNSNISQYEPIKKLKTIEVLAKLHFSSPFNVKEGNFASTTINNSKL